MDINKVIYGSQTLIDLTADTVSPDNLLAGATAHDMSGAQIVGTVSVPTKLSQLTNDTGFITATALAGYLPLTGGKVSGRIYRVNNASSWIGDRDRSIIYNTSYGGGSYYPVVGNKTNTGSWTIGILSTNEQLYFNHTLDSDYSAGTNDSKKSILNVPSSSENTIITTDNIGSQSVNYANSADRATNDAYGHTLLGMISDGNYMGMTGMGGSASAFVRTTSNGIIPHQAGGPGNGHSYIGTNTWYFANGYFDRINDATPLTSSNYSNYAIPLSRDNSFYASEHNGSSLPMALITTNIVVANNQPYLAEIIVYGYAGNSPTLCLIQGYNYNNALYAPASFATWISSRSPNANSRPIVIEYMGKLSIVFPMSGYWEYVEARVWVANGAKNNEVTAIEFTDYFAFHTQIKPKVYYPTMNSLT